MNTNKVLAIIVVLLLIVLGGMYVAAQQGMNVPLFSTASTEPARDEPIPTDIGGTIGEAPMSATVAYSSAGFSPETVIVKRGGTVTFNAQGDVQMWVGSDEHPTHTHFDGTSREEHCHDNVPSTSFDQCAVGSTYSFTFDKTGTFDYHNHRSAAHTGSVTVVE